MSQVEKDIRSIKTDVSLITSCLIFYIVFSAGKCAKDVVVEFKLLEIQEKVQTK